MLNKLEKEVGSDKKSNGLCGFLKKIKELEKKKAIEAPKYRLYSVIMHDYNK